MNIQSLRYIAGTMHARTLHNILVWCDEPGFHINFEHIMWWHILSKASHWFQIFGKWNLGNLRTNVERDHLMCICRDMSRLGWQISTDTRVTFTQWLNLNTKLKGLGDIFIYMQIIIIHNEHNFIYLQIIIIDILLLTLLIWHIYDKEFCRFVHTIMPQSNELRVTYSTVIFVKSLRFWRGFITMYLIIIYLYRASCIVYYVFAYSR